MDGDLSDLTTTSASSEYSEIRFKWFRGQTTVHRIEFLDWMIDGIPLRALFRGENGELPGEVTTVQNAAVNREFGSHVLRVLAGERLHAECSARMPDGRIPLLLCQVCYDLNCPTLTADVHIGAETVQWCDIGWQVAYEPFDPTEQARPPAAFEFDRAHYEALLADLLSTDAETS